MRKLITLFILLMILFLVSCSNKNASDNITMEKDDAFISDIKNISDNYGYEVISKEPIKTSSERELTININKEQYIDVYFKNLGYKNATGDNLFNIEYHKLDSKDLNLDLFIQITNLVSKKGLSSKELSEFLNADENAYPPEKYNYKKMGDENIKKVKADAENWELIYTEYKDDSISLYFGGITK